MNTRLENSEILLVNPSLECRNQMIPILKEVQHHCSIICSQQISPSHTNSASIFILDSNNLPDTLFGSSNWILKQAQVPKLIICDSNKPTRSYWYEKGFDDYLCYPLIKQEVILRINNQLLFHKTKKRRSIQKANICRDKRIYTTTTPLREEQLVQDTCRFIDANLTQDLRLDFIARTMGTNRDSLNKSFRNTLNQSVHNWIQEQRLIKAASLLTNDCSNIQMISTRVGFKNSNYFSTRFKNHYGVSPLQYRNKFHKQRNVCRIERSKNENFAIFSTR